ncbi:hypothetical protein DFJ73DRAFT_839244 [Zopfochytrium polystomum]|nr:hypothetical protein DFJ73DRAFT_839244 [Zopfochytrium polystomum]
MKLAADAVTILAVIIVATTAAGVQAAATSPDMNACMAAGQIFEQDIAKCANSTGTQADAIKCLCGIPTLLDDYKATIEACKGIVTAPPPLPSVDQFQALCNSAGLPASGASSAGGASSTGPTSSASGGSSAGGAVSTGLTSSTSNGSSAGVASSTGPTSSSAAAATTASTTNFASGAASVYAGRTVFALTSFACAAALM